MTHHDAGHRHSLLLLVIVRELEPADEVEAHEGEDHDPQGEERLAVEDAPTVGEVGHGEELQREGQLDEAQHHLDHVHPRTRLRSLLQPGREHGEE